MPVPPPDQWEKGIHPEYTAFVIEVLVAIDQHGVLWSNHRLQNEKDQEISSTLNSGGLEHASNALLLEAIRKETLYQVLIRASHEPDFARKLSETDHYNKIIEQVTATATAVLKRSVDGLVPEAADAILQMIRNGPANE